MDVRKAILFGLTTSPKYIPGWYRYDEDGSKLNDKCLEDTDYYVHRSELNVMQTKIAAMLEHDTQYTALVDMGSGNCQKTRFFIDELLKYQDKIHFYPIDISKEFLFETCGRLSAEYADKLDITPIAADYENGINKASKCPHSKLILWFSSIQCLEAEDQVRKLRQIKSVLTAINFYMNSIQRLKREELCTINPDNYKLEVQFVQEDSPHKMSSVQVLLRSQLNNSFKLPFLGITVDMAEGEPLYLHEGVGISHKFTMQQVQRLVQESGLRLVETWQDDQHHVVFCKCKA
ncbi:uncharacterized protein LOC110454493 isoform X2 [Mizuhopecten yessoensis]|uniref:uncharacterized protein LOC110454493 isoform X2 n=1 Tax=Mizuhopecten yessoensis TaxID=6573 RepID=UPI000B45743E|nr:uncharacterized protein LOC110454493 isoform X2 [Mizuhopecten yessoensis]